jgi:hypothetical protein
MKRTRLTVKLVKVLLTLTVAFLGIYLAGTLTHRYPKHFSVLGVFACVFALVQFGWAYATVRDRRRERGADVVNFGCSEAGLRVHESSESEVLIPWDQIRSARYSKALGIITVRSPLLDGRYFISRRGQEGHEPGTFEKAAALIKQSLGSPRWREHWI